MKYALVWFTVDWWKYLLERPRTWKKILCRASLHKPGVNWYNPGGFEPDMRCRGCGDNLG